MRHFIDIGAMSPDALRWILAESLRRKAARAGRAKAAPDSDQPLAGRVIAAIFEKNSTRTRLSFDLAMRQLGGAAITLNAADLQLGRGEPVADTARVLARYVDGVAIRALRHASVTGFAQASSVPVVNGLTDRSHPCQIMADLMTIAEHFGEVGGRRLAWLGDYNNVARSLLEAAGPFGFALSLGCPPDFAPPESEIAAAQARGADIRVHADPLAAVAGADAVLTDVWVSMGDGDEARRRAALAPFQVNAAVMAAASPGAVFLHCLPAIRGEEVSEAVIDGPQSVVWAEAENRIHAQKAALLWCFGAGPI